MKTLLAFIGAISILLATFITGMFIMYTLIMTDPEIQTIISQSIEEYNNEFNTQSYSLEKDFSKFGIVYKK